MVQGHEQVLTTNIRIWTEQWEVYANLYLLMRVTTGYLTQKQRARDDQ